MYIIIGIIAVVVDQLTKSYAIRNFKETSKEIIPNWLNFTYVENRGAAFGFLSDHPWVFTGLASIFVIFMTGFLLKNYNKLGSFYKFTLVIIVAGALGNLIDRLRYGYVVDFIQSPLGGRLNFPVFNLADVYLTLAAIILVIYIIFSDGDKNDIFS